MCRVLDRENVRWDEGNREKSWMNGKRKIRREELGWSGLAAEERLARAKKSGGRGKFRWPKRKAWIPLPPALATLSPSARPSPKHQPPSGLRGSMSATLLLATVAPHNCKSCACYDARLSDGRLYLSNGCSRNNCRAMIISHQSSDNYLLLETRSLANDEQILLILLFHSYNKKQRLVAMFPKICLKWAKIVIILTELRVRLNSN